MGKPLSIALIINKQEQKNAIDSLGRFRIKRENLLTQIEIHENGLLVEMTPEERTMYEDHLDRLKKKYNDLPTEDLIIQKYIDRCSKE